jgi:hypothetical protein
MGQGFRPENTNAARASHPGRMGREISRSCLVTAGRRNDRLGPTARPQVRRICRSQLPIRDLAITSPQLSGGQQALILLSEQKGEEGRNARATSFALARDPGMSPGGFTLKNRRVVAGSAAVIQQAQELSRFSLRNTLGEIGSRCN